MQTDRQTDRQTDKCKQTDRQTDRQTTIPINYGGSTILSISIGKVQFIQEYSVETAKSGDNLCKQLTELDDIRSAMLLLRLSHSSN